MIIFFYGSIIASIVFYFSNLLVIKRIKQDADEAWPAIIASISLAFIVASIFILCAK